MASAQDSPAWSTVVQTGMAERVTENVNFGDWNAEGGWPNRKTQRAELPAIRLPTPYR
jgi:hypothetical protein